MEVVAIPAGFPVGALIGKGGCNLQQLQHRFNTKVNIDTDTMQATCLGGSCTEAAEAIRRQIAVAGTHPGAYPHPGQVVYVLPTCGTSAYCFQKHPGPAPPQILNKRAVQLYVLSPLTPPRLGATKPPPPSTPGVLPSALSSTPGTSGAAGGGCVTSWTLHPGAGVLEKVFQAVSQAKTVSPAFDEIKLRYCLGKQTFYESRGPHSAAALQQQQHYALDQLRSSSIHNRGDFKSMFSEYIEEPAVKRIEAALSGRGFKLSQTKVHASVHLHDHGTSSGAVGGVVVSLCITDSGACRVRKIKSSTAKPIFVSFLNANAKQPDFRLRLLGQYLVKEPGTSGSRGGGSSSSSSGGSGGGGGSGSGSDAEAAWQYARACTWSSKLQAVQLPSSERFVVETVRTKTKRVYAGTCLGHALRCTVSRVQNEDGAFHTLGGCAPELQAALLPSGAVGPAHRAALGTTVDMCRWLATASSHSQATGSARVP